MTKILYIISLLSISASLCISQTDKRAEKFTGYYRNDKGKTETTLNLAKDNTFLLTFQNDSVPYDCAGTWKLKKDTLILHLNLRVGAIVGKHNDTLIFIYKGKQTFCPFMSKEYYDCVTKKQK